MITTTLTRIRSQGPCGLDPRKLPLTGYQKLVAFLGPDHGVDDPIPYAVILNSNGIADALWCCRAEPEHASVWRLFVVRCARRALSRVPNPDPRSITACDVAERHAHGLATDEDLAQARRDAYAASAHAAHATVCAVAAAAERQLQSDDFLKAVS
jgi:hypothetical protein